MKPIRDIRLYGIGEFRVRDFPKEAQFFAQRIARKLREYGFALGDCDHLYLNFTSELKSDRMQLVADSPAKWMREIECGLDPTAFRRKSDAAKCAYLTRAIFRGLRFVCRKNSRRLAIVAKVEGDIRTHGSELEMLARSKETFDYRVAITFQIDPAGRGSIGWIEYENKKTHQWGKLAFIKLRLWDDIYPIVGKIAVEKGIVRLSPLRSAKADVYTARYKVPIEMTIEKILQSPS